jgi:hypothetical protein
METWIPDYGVNRQAAALELRAERLANLRKEARETLDQDQGQGAGGAAAMLEAGSRLKVDVSDALSKEGKGTNRTDTPVEAADLSLVLGGKGEPALAGMVRVAGWAGTVDVDPELCTLTLRQSSMRGDDTITLALSTGGGLQSREVRPT